MKLKLFISCLLMGSIGIAKMTEKEYFKQVASWPSAPEKWLKETHWPDQTILEAGKAAKKITRSSASSTEPKDAAWYESKMSEAMKKIRTEFLALKSVEQLDEMLTTLDTNYDKYPTDVKFFAAQVIPLKSLRGFIWKMVPAVESTKILHSVLVTQVKSWSVNQRIFFPAEQWTVGFDYVTQPYMVGGEFLATRFKGEADIQGFFVSQVYPALAKSLDRIALLDMSSNEIVWDNQLIYGASKAPEALDQYRLFGRVEQYATLSNLGAALAQITLNRAYSMQDGLKMNSAIGREYGWDTVLSKVDGVPAKKVVEIIRDNKAYPHWGTLFPDGAYHLELSRRNMITSVLYAQRMVLEMEARSPGEEFFTDTTATATTVNTNGTVTTTIYDRPMQYRLKKMLEMLQGVAELRSSTTGETTTVDLPKFFADPPKSLKGLYGIHFNEQSEMLDYKVDGAKVAEYRNYQHGRPDKWDLTVYKKYFPKATSDAELLKAARVFSQSWGGALVAMPLTTFIE